MDLILFGMQGSGKGTQARLLAEHYNMEYFETGAQLRKLSKEETPLATKVKGIMNEGKLVPNEVVMEIVEDFLANIPIDKAVIFDGIPRKHDQANALEKVLADKNRKFIPMLIEISEEVAIKRLTSRRICKGCKTIYPADYEKEQCEKCNGILETRHDDNPTAITARLKAYNEETIPVIEKYRQYKNMIVINGEQPIEKVDKDVREALQGIL